MIFTRHAVERYREFHMMGQPSATDADAMAILEAHAEEAVKLPSRTKYGDEVWTIHSLGIELVVKRDMPQPVCVTVLPPTRFRGLTPLQAEAIDVKLRAVVARSAELAHEVEEIAAAVVPQSVVKRVPIPTEERRENERLLAKLAESKRAVQLAEAERHVLGGILKTMRVQIHDDAQRKGIVEALRLAVRELRVTQTAGAVEALDAIAEIDPHYLTDEFLYRESDDGPRTPQPENPARKTP